MMDTFQAIDSRDSRYAMKQRDIAATVARMGEAKAKAQAEWEQGLGDTLTELTMENVLRGGGDRCIAHGSERFRQNYDKWLRSL
jgi:hypothetical protein